MNIQELDLNLLFVFDAIFTNKNISKAARQLNLSQPAASNALTRLRNQLGDPLFVRDGNGVIPTARAEAIIDPVRSALKTIEIGLGQTEKFDWHTSKQHFRLIVADPLEPIVMPKLLEGTSTNSQLTYELLPPQQVNIEEALLEDKIDLALFLLPSRIDGIDSKPLIPVNLVMIVRKDHPRIKDEVLPEAMLRENFVGLMLAPGKLQNSEKLSIWHKLQQRIVCHVNKVSSIAQTVALTDLVGFVPKIYAEHISQHYNIQIIEMPSPLSNQNFQMIWHKRSELSEAQLWLRDKIYAIFEKE